ncbi:MAG TPA: succinyl-diaminopimelate desuccinylase [Hyphomicrobiaceae bacterium]|nr:succinyl-diaminopimelate desuccinylase [Hyphomicrobiaceae bacterium]
MDATDPVALAAALIRCQSVTPDEGGALSLIADVLGPLGFTSHRLTMTEPGTPDVENLYTRLGTGKPNLCFAGHTDVVPPGDPKAWALPPFSGEIRDGLLHGRGAVDMKGAIACFMAATARHLKSRGGAIPGSISFLITGDEEGPSINGTMKVLDWMARRGETMEAAIVGEPSNPKQLGEEIKIGRRGSLNGELVVAGKQGHVAYPQLADNPVPKLIGMLEHIDGLILDDGTPDFEPSNLEITVISVPNTATNVIPSEARAKFNIRYNTRWTRPRLEALLRETCAAAAVEVEAQYKLGFSGTGDVFLTKPGPLVDHMRAAVMQVTGRTPALTTNGGTSDARFIQAYCPVIEFGLTNALAHHVDERVAVADLEALTRIYEAFLGRYFA